MGGEQIDRHNIDVNDLLLYSIKDRWKKYVAYLSCKKGEHRYKLSSENSKKGTINRFVW
jgi:hypothetical protein